MPTSTSQTGSRRPVKSSARGYPFWSPRFWHGMMLGDWLRLLADYRFRMHPLRIPMALIITGCAPVNSGLSLVQRWRHGRRIEQTEIANPPIFIIGHWRSGTTYLHELLVRDPRFGYPTTYECFAPSHFVVSEWILPKLLWFLLPGKRPMDNMGAGFGYPQEDEFALANLGCPTPYTRMMFPNEPPRLLELLDMQDVPADVLARWKHDMVWFVKALAYYKPDKTLVLKSPPHTGRIGVLAELFPGARFIHITRHPETLFVSTRRLWSSLDSVQGLQFPRNQRLDEYIFECFERMYRGFETQRQQLNPDQICELSYEELVRDPVQRLAGIYDRLDLGDFEAVRPSVEAYVAERKDYQPNRHEELDPELRAEIRRRWAWYYEQYAYESQPAAAGT